MRPTVLLAAAAALALTAAAHAQKKDLCLVDAKPLAKTASEVVINRKRAGVCNAKCLAAFRKAPEKYLKSVAACPVLENPVAVVKPEHRIVLNNNLYYFCCEGCHGGFLQTPDKIKRIKDVVSGEVFEVGSESPRIDYKGQHYLFATDETKATFEKTPDKYTVAYGK